MLERSVMAGPSGGFRVICLLYLLVSVFCWHYKYSRDRYNNYRIFKGVYTHTLEGKNLYLEYPAEYGDSNHYGPVFSVVVAPFALLPDGAGLLLWNLVNALVFVVSLTLLPLPRSRINLLLLWALLEFANSQHAIQFNPIVAAMIVLTFVAVERGQDWWAGPLIVLGALVKLYPIIGVVFILFSKRKGAFVLSCLVSFVVFFFLPLLITNSGFLVQSYFDWFHSLQHKDVLNKALDSAQDFSVMGIVRRVASDPSIPNMPILLAGGAIFVAPLFLLRNYALPEFRLRVLASALLFVVLFSTGSEHPTYVIAVAGAFLSMLLEEKIFTKTNIALLILLLILTGLGPTDVFPPPVRTGIINRYAMKAWPCLAVWLINAYRMFTSRPLKPAEESAVLSISHHN